MGSITLQPLLAADLQPLIAADLQPLIAADLQPLIAADLLQTIFYVVVFILWGVAQLVGARKEAKNNKQPRHKPPQPQPVDLAEGAPLPQNQGPQNQGARNQGPRNQEEALRSEVEDFLRRAQGKPPKSQPTPQPVRQQKLSRSPQPEQKRPVAPVARRAPVTLQEGHSLRDEGVAEHVARHISTQDIAAHTKTLGAEVATADDQLELRLHEKFDHDVGRLEHFETSAGDKLPKVDIAAEVAEMLRSPDGMRQLIIANEILRRPEW